MAVTEIPVSHFFIWTAHGNFIQKIKFCSNKWTELKNILDDFYVKMYLPPLFGNKEYEDICMLAITSIQEIHLRLFSF